MTAICGAESTTGRIARRLAESVGPHRYTMWFDRSAKLAYRDEYNRLEVAVPNQFVADWIDRHFASDLRQAAREAVGGEVALEVQIDPRHFTAKQDGGNGEAASHAPRRRVNLPPSRPKGAVLRHRLGDFVLGPCNELAFAAANRLIDEPSATGSPLFIHGGVGLGKTHLLQGICQKRLDEDPTAKVRYTTAEQFTNEFVTAVRTHKIDAFRTRIRRLDLLAVDDVHFIANKEATQREFLHCLNNIELQGARVALASDSHPKLIEQFSEALVSRCVRGMVVQIRQPDTATRVKIVRALAKRRGISLMETVVAVLAQRCDGSVREIEGLLARLHALAFLVGDAPINGGNGAEGSNGAEGTTRNDPTASAQAPRAGEIGHALVNRLFDAETTKPTVARNVRFQTILDVVCQQMHVSANEVLGRSRHRRIALARSVVTYLTREMTRMSYPEIAAATKRLSHSTVIAATRRIQQRIDEQRLVMLENSAEPVAMDCLIDRLRRNVAQHADSA